MTIVEAIKTVLKDNAAGMTASEVYDEIVLRNLYVFRAKKPIYVVNGEIRRRCYGLDFPTAYPVKQFKISGYKNNIKKGTAKVTVKGIGAFAGTKTLNFKIIEKKGDYKGALIGDKWQ